MNIAYIGATPQARVYKQVKLLKEKYDVNISLVCFRYDELLFNDLFDKTYVLKKGNPYNKIESILVKLNPDIVHLFSDKFAIAEAIIDSKIPYVYDPYDYFLEQDGISNDTMMEHWKMMAQNASGIVLRYDESIKETKKFQYLQIEDTKPIIQLFDYACSDFFINKRTVSSRMDKVVHIGYLSSLDLSKETHIATQFNNVAKSISPYRGYDIFCSLWSDKFDLLSVQYQNIKEKFRDNFNLYSALPQEQLNETISSYKYGSYIHDSSIDSDMPYILKSVGNKIFNYIEAGLPIITTNEITASAKFIEQHKIGVNIKTMEMFNDNIDSIDDNYEELLKTVYHKRENELNILNHIYKLYDLYKLVIKRSK
ncbi:MAG: hypothetical protein U9O56_04470 [Campylobacterota bacterium]|nr:hypothetical protein [Campylobacterota bacterium]